jgi:hypothetical protein
LSARQLTSERDNSRESQTTQERDNVRARKLESETA